MAACGTCTFGRSLTIHPPISYCPATPPISCFFDLFFFAVALSFFSCSYIPPPVQLSTFTPFFTLFPHCRPVLNQAFFSFCLFLSVHLLLDHHFFPPPSNHALLNTNLHLGTPRGTQARKAKPKDKRIPVAKVRRHNPHPSSLSHAAKRHGAIFGPRQRAFIPRIPRGTTNACCPKQLQTDPIYHPRPFHTASHRGDCACCT